MYVLLFSFIAITNPKPMVQIELELPDIQAKPYHRPYVAIWLETPERKGVHTIALWTGKPDWLKDLRQWWRKLGRSMKVDGISGATRKPGSHRIVWDGLDAEGRPIQPGIYLLNFEASREEGGREYLRQEITIGAKAAQKLTLTGTRELRAITITIQGE